MRTLYHCLSARSFRPLWTMEELGLDYQLVVLPFPPRQFKREYLKTNPLGTVPAFFDGDTRMTESAAICQYLVERYGPTPLKVEVSEPDYGAWLNFLHFGEATLTFPQTLVLRYSRLEPPARRNPQVAQDYARWYLARLRGIEQLVGAGHLCAGRFTVADVSVGFALLLGEYLGLAGEYSPAVQAYLAGLKARPAFQRAEAAERAAAEAQGVATDIAAMYLPRDEA